MTKLPPQYKRTLGIQRAAVAHLIHHEMRKRGYNCKIIAAQLGITVSAVSRTVTGIIHSPKVPDALKSAGVPENLLFDPRNVTLPLVQGATTERKVG